MSTVDRRQLETFLSSPKVVGDVGFTTASSWDKQVSKEKAKTKWVREGNTILPSGEFIKEEEFSRLPSDEKEMLARLGVPGFNAFKQENIKVGKNSWLSKETNEYKVLDAVKEGYVTHEEIRQVTGLSEQVLSRAIAKLRELGLVK